MNSPTGVYVESVLCTLHGSIWIIVCICVFVMYIMLFFWVVFCLVFRSVAAVGAFGFWVCQFLSWASWFWCFSLLLASLASWALWLLGFLTLVAFVAFVACGFSLFWRLWLLGDMLHNSCKQNENNRQNKRTTLMLRRTRFNTSLPRSTLWNSLF